MGRTGGTVNPCTNSSSKNDSSTGVCSYWQSCTQLCRHILQQRQRQCHLRHMLPLALVWTKTRLARRRGLYINKYRQSQSGWSAPCMHGRRRITQIAVGPVPFSHKYVEQQWNNKINICGQHCCTGTKLNVEILPDSASHVRQQGQRRTGEQQ